jgi:ubiquinol-cytochrome c reductase cytochrome c1 subunit
MKKFIASFGVAILALVFTAPATFSAEEAEHATPHYPIKMPEAQSWSFAGPFGTYDKGQLQRGLKVYTEVCAACHSMKRIPFRTLEDLGYTEAQVKSFAAQYEVEDGPNADGEMFTRAAQPADTFPGPYANDQEATVANNGALPPDFSLIAKARGVGRGFPQFIFDIFTQYAEGGPDYIYSLLIGYGEEPPAHIEILDGLYYNPYFNAGSALAMAQPLYEESVTYDDGTPATLEQQARDVAAFLMWAAEPHMDERKEMGFRVMIFLVLFAIFLYIAKQQVWSRVEH